MSFTTEFRLQIETKERPDPVKMKAVLLHLRHSLNELEGKPPEGQMFGGLYEWDDFIVFAPGAVQVDSYLGELV